MQNPAPNEPSYDLGAVVARNLGHLAEDAVGALSLVALLIAGLGLPSLI